MSCSNPIRMYRSVDGPNGDGTWPLTARPSNGYKDLPVVVPCGRCIFCRLELSRQKTVRIMHELQYWDTACFLTLTYDDDNLPVGPVGLPTLTRGQRSHLTLYHKRLRKQLVALGYPPIKYFACGEYGDRFERPHYHEILFGCDFSHDRLKRSSNPPLYQSPTLDAAWQAGHAVIGNVTWDSASYVASYVTKKLSGEQADYHYASLGRESPYLVSSSGLGKRWIADWWPEVYTKGRDNIVVRGHECSPPRYYDDWLKANQPSVWREVYRSRCTRQDESTGNPVAAVLRKQSELALKR